MKAIIPVAGLGTRMLPASKAIPKEMLTLADKPLIQYVVNECAAAGIKDIIFVTHSSKNAIENHFDTSFELESTLEKRVKRQLLEEVRSITPKGVTIMQIRQGQAKGLGHAVLCARTLIGNEPFAVILPDVLIDDAASDLKKDNLAAMVREFKKTGTSQILVEPVPQESVDQYGIVDLGGVDLKPGESALLAGIVEKPEASEAPSNLSVVGRYVFPPEIMDILARTAPGAGDEIQLTDGIFTLMQQQPVNAFYMTGKSHDCGSKLGYMQAFVEHAMRHDKEGAAFSAWLKSLINNS